MWTVFDYAYWSVGAGAVTAMLSQMRLQLKVSNNLNAVAKEDLERKLYDLPVSQIENSTMVEVGYHIMI